MLNVGPVSALLLALKYRDGMSDRLIANYMAYRGREAARWKVERAHREIAGKLNIPVYK